MIEFIGKSINYTDFLSLKKNYKVTIILNAIWEAAF